MPSASLFSVIPLKLALSLSMETIFLPMVLTKRELPAEMIRVNSVFVAFILNVTEISWFGGAASSTVCSFSSLCGFSVG